MHRRRKTHLLPFLVLLAVALVCCGQSFFGGAAVAVLKNHVCCSVTSFRGKICLAWQWGQTPDPRRWKLSLYEPLPKNGSNAKTSAATGPAAMPDNLALLRSSNQTLLAVVTSPQSSSAAVGFHVASRRALFAMTIPAWFYILFPVVLVTLALRRYRKSPRPLAAALRRIDTRIRRRAPWILAAFVLAAALFLETRRRQPSGDIMCNVIEPNLPRASASPQNNPAELTARTFRIAGLTEPRHSLSSTASRNIRAKLLLGLVHTALPAAAECRATPSTIDIRATPAQADYIAALLQALQP